MNHFYSTMMRPRLYLIGLLMLIPLLTACASTAMAPTDSLEAAKNAISNA